MALFQHTVGSISACLICVHAQVMVLVLSNFAVFPGAMLAFQRQVPVLGCILTASGVASIFYHLCDCDIWCIGGLSFQSLQVSGWPKGLLVPRHSFCCAQSLNYLV